MIGTLVQAWRRSLQVKLEVLLVVSSVGPLLAVLAVLALTGYPAWLPLALALLAGEVLILNVGQRLIKRVTVPLHELSIRLHATARLTDPLRWELEVLSAQHRLDYPPSSYDHHGDQRNDYQHDWVETANCAAPA